MQPLLIDATSSSELALEPAIWTQAAASLAAHMRRPHLSMMALLVEPTLGARRVGHPGGHDRLGCRPHVAQHSGLGRLLPSRPMSGLEDSALRQDHDVDVGKILGHHEAACDSSARVKRTACGHSGLAQGPIVAAGPGRLPRPMSGFLHAACRHMRQCVRGRRSAQEKGRSAHACSSLPEPHARAGIGPARHETSRQDRCCRADSHAGTKHEVAMRSVPIRPTAAHDGSSRGHPSG